MKNIVIIALLVLCVSGCAQFDHDPSSLVRALEQDHLAKTPPSGYKLSASVIQPHQAGKMRYAEYIPVNETVENWSEMVTMSTFFMQGKIPDITPERYLNFSIGQHYAYCATVTADGPKTESEGSYPNAQLFLSCPMNSRTHKPEYSFTRVIKGKENMYVVTKTLTSPPTPAQTAEAWKYVNSIYICESYFSAEPCPTTSTNPLTDNFKPTP